MQLILAKNVKKDMTRPSLDNQGRTREIYFRHSIGRGTDRSASGRDIQTRPGGGGICAVGNGQDVGSTNDGTVSGNHARHSVGDEARLCENAGQNAVENAGTRKRASRQPTRAAGADRPARGASFALLSGVRRQVEPLSKPPDALRRRYSRRPEGGSCRAYDSPRLVCAVPEAGGTCGDRRLAELDARQSGIDADGLAALRPGQHAVANRRGVQFSPADQADRKRIDPTMASIGGYFARLARTDSPRGLAIGGFARRRDKLASVGQNTLVVVFRGRRSYLFYDRPLPRQSGAYEVFYSRIRGNVGDRLLGRLQQSLLRASAVVLGASGARLPDRGTVQAARQGLAGIRQKDETADPRRDPTWKARRHCGRRVFLSSAAFGCPFAGVDRHAVGGFPSGAADQASASASRRLVHVPRSSGRSFRQQFRRAEHPPGGDYA